MLGVLSAAERRAAELRHRARPEFAAEVAFWEARLGGLAEGVCPRWRRPPKSGRGIEAQVAAHASRDERAGLWKSLAFWRTFAIASAALAAASIAGLSIWRDCPRLGRRCLQRSMRNRGSRDFVAAANPADGSLTIVPAALLTGEAAAILRAVGDSARRQAALAWPGRSQAPVKVVVPPELLPHVSANSVLAISLEPPGGSPTGQPTGPMIANGKLASL